MGWFDEQLGTPTTQATPPAAGSPTPDAAQPSGGSWFDDQLKKDVPKKKGKIDQGYLDSIMGMGKDVLEGAGSGVISTGLGAYELARKGVHATGMGDLPEAPEFLKKAGANVQYDEQGNPVETSNSFGFGRGAERVGEFMAPGGLVSKGAEAASVLGRGAEIGARVLGDTAAAAAVTGVQSGGDLTQMGESAILSGLTSGAFSTVGGILKSIPNSAIYASKLKLPQRFLGERANEIFSKAVDDGILISKAGANKAEAIENLTRAERDHLINQHAGSLVDINVIRAPALKLRQMAEQLGETGIVKDIDKRLAKFEAANGAKPAIAPSTVTSPILGPNGQAITTQVPGQAAKPAKITMLAAQQAKDDFNMLAQNMFGKFSPGAGQIRKLMGAGLKDAMEAISPEIKDLNHDIQNTKLLKNAINKYLDSNPQLVDSRTALLAWWHTPLAIIYGAWSNPYVRSALAIAKDRAERSAAVPVMQAIPRLAGALPTAVQGPTQ